MSSQKLSAPATPAALLSYQFTPTSQTSKPPSQSASTNTLPNLELFALSPQINTLLINIIKPYLQKDAIVILNNQNQIQKQILHLAECVHLFYIDIMHQIRCYKLFNTLHIKEIEKTKKRLKNFSSLSKSTTIHSTLKNLSSKRNPNNSFPTILPFSPYIPYTSHLVINNRMYKLYLTEFYKHKSILLNEELNGVFFYSDSPAPSFPLSQISYTDFIQQQQQQKPTNQHYIDDKGNLSNIPQYLHQIDTLINHSERIGSDSTRPEHYNLHTLNHLPHQSKKNPSRFTMQQHRSYDLYHTNETHTIPINSSDAKSTPLSNDPLIHPINSQQSHPLIFVSIIAPFSHSFQAQFQLIQLFDEKRTDEKQQTNNHQRQNQQQQIEQFFLPEQQEQPQTPQITSNNNNIFLSTSPSSPAFFPSPYISGLLPLLHHHHNSVDDSQHLTPDISSYTDPLNQIATQLFPSFSGSSIQVNSSPLIALRRIIPPPTSVKEYENLSSQHLQIFSTLPSIPNLINSINQLSMEVEQIAVHILSLHRILQKEKITNTLHRHATEDEFDFHYQEQ